MADEIDIDRRMAGILDQAANTGSVGTATLLWEHGFRPAGDEIAPKVVHHPESGVTLAWNRQGVRISFHSRHAPGGMALVDLPYGTPLGVVQHVALAVHLTAAP